MPIPKILIFCPLSLPKPFIFMTCLISKIALTYFKGYFIGLVQGLQFWTENLNTGHAHVFTLVPFVCDLLAYRLDRIDTLSVRLAVIVAIPIAGFCSRFILLLRPKSFYASFYPGGKKVINSGLISCRFRKVRPTLGSRELDWLLSPKGFTQRYSRFDPFRI